jgi:hypothetical protein
MQANGTCIGEQRRRSEQVASCYAYQPSKDLTKELHILVATPCPA